MTLNPNDETPVQTQSSLILPDGTPAGPAAKQGFVDMQAANGELLRMPMVATVVLDGKIMEAISQRTAALVCQMLSDPGPVSG